MASLDKLTDALYRGSQVTAIHSLEALVGRIDFDRLGSCKRMGSMLGSPSSTAAFLIYSSRWDNEAEEFLQDAFKYGEGKESGGFASAYSIDFFEISWVLSTLLESKIELSRSEHASMHKIADYLQSELHRSQGILGFARDMLPDADDTAKCIYTLQLLNRNADPQPMIAHFRTGEVFKTYINERTPSLSTHCNVLKALLVQPDSDQYVDSIRVALDFICQAWFSGSVTDKWNVAREYTYMLLAQGLTQLLAQRDHLPCLSSYFNIKIPVIISQLLSRVLRAQASDGSWCNSKHEVTAYCILALVSLNPIPFPLGINDKIASAIILGREYLEASKNSWKSEPIWIEKVRYSSKLLTGVYCICALTAPISSITLPKLSNNSPSAHMLKLFLRLPIFSTSANSRLALECALFESQAFLPLLQSTRLDTFLLCKDLSKEKYMEIIPFAWTSCNSLQSDPLPADILQEMMMISLLNFQADEYFEQITTHSNASALRLLIDGICGIQPDTHKRAADTNEIGSSCLSKNHPLSSKEGNHEMNELHQEPTHDISITLTAFASRILQHRAVSRATYATNMQIRYELAAYLRAQVDSAINRSRTLELRKGRKALYNWARTSGADDTSCPYSFAFYVGLSASVLGGDDVINSAPGRYLMEALCRSLATMCRMYNDYGSLSRDRCEGNLNCIDFFDHSTLDTGPEEMQPNDGQVRSRKEDFRSQDGDQECVKRRKVTNETWANHSVPYQRLLKSREVQLNKDMKAKMELMRLAEFERRCVELALSDLKNLGLQGPMLDALLLFINVTDLFGQIYAVRDIGTKTR